MPGRPDQDGDHQLRVLDSAWHETRQHWRDDMTRRFDTDYRTSLFNESRSYLGALRALMELLNAAERDTEY
jgi:hypothetical protein